MSIIGHKLVKTAELPEKQQYLRSMITMAIAVGIGNKLTNDQIMSTLVNLLVKTAHDLGLGDLQDCVRAVQLTVDRYKSIEINIEDIEEVEEA